MGVVGTIKFDKWPRQGSHVGKVVLVVFHYDAAHATHGIIVRDDGEDPFMTIIRLDDGRHVLGTECQWRPA